MCHAHGHSKAPFEAGEVEVSLIGLLSYQIRQPDTPFPLCMPVKGRRARRDETQRREEVKQLQRHPRAVLPLLLS